MKIRFLLIVLAWILGSNAQADNITHDGTTVNMKFVDIGYAGNAAPVIPTEFGPMPGYGAVGYEYRIGTFEVTANQWNTVIAADAKVGNVGIYSGSQPAARASWFEAAKFANWLTSGDAYAGAYQFNESGLLTAVDRNAATATYGTVYVIPNEDEWYKAAYFKADGSGYTLYSTGDALPTAGVGGVNYNSAIGNPWDVGSGIAESNGTYDMNGNIYEWLEMADDVLAGENATIRGGTSESDESRLRSTDRLTYPTTYENYLVGFRVAAIPEPSSIMLMGVTVGIGVFMRRRLRR